MLGTISGALARSLICISDTKAELVLSSPLEVNDYIFYIFWDINDNVFNWPINQLRNLQKFFKYSLIHAPCA